MVLGILDYVFIVVAFVVAFILFIAISVIFSSLNKFFRRKSIQEQAAKKEAKLQEILKETAALREATYLLHEQIKDKSNAEVNFAQKLDLRLCGNKIDAIELGLEYDSEHFSLGSASDALREISETVTAIGQQVDSYEASHQRVVLKFMDKKANNGIGSLNGFDSARFVVENSADLEISHDAMTSALGTWSTDACLQDFQRVNGDWVGSVFFVDTKAPEDGALITVVVEKTAPQH